MGKEEGGKECLIIVEVTKDGVSVLRSEVSNIFHDELSKEVSEDIHANMPNTVSIDCLPNRDKVPDFSRSEQSEKSDSKKGLAEVLCARLGNEELVGTKTKPDSKGDCDKDGAKLHVPPIVPLDEEHVMGVIAKRNKSDNERDDTMPDCTIDAEATHQTCTGHKTNEPNGSGVVSALSELLVVVGVEQNG